MKILKELFRNKKVDALNEEIESLKERLEFVEYKLKSPQPYKIGDIYEKNKIVTNVKLERFNRYYLFNLNTLKIHWVIELTDKKTGKKETIYRR